MTRISKKLYLAVLLLALSPFSAVANNFVVVTHNDNDISLSGDELVKEIKQLFLRKKFRWGNGKLATPLSVPRDSAAFRAFQENVLQMTAHELRTHWIRLKQLNGDTAPREVASERLIFRLIQKDIGSFSIVKRASAEKRDDIKILFGF